MRGQRHLPISRPRPEGNVRGHELVNFFQTLLEYIDRLLTSFIHNNATRVALRYCKTLFQDYLISILQTPRFSHSALMLLKWEWRMGNPNGTYCRLIVDNADNAGRLSISLAFFHFHFHASDFPHSFSYANRTRL